MINAGIRHDRGQVRRESGSLVKNPPRKYTNPREYHGNEYLGINLKDLAAGHTGDLLVSLYGHSVVNDPNPTLLQEKTIHVTREDFPSFDHVQLGRLRYSD